jgi:hypothetical protein
MKSQEARRAVAKEKLEAARKLVPVGSTEFDAALAEGDLTRAFEALEKAAGQGSGPIWAALADAASWIGLIDKSRELARKAGG